MTEAEWLNATDPTPMLEWLGMRASPRKLRLFACRCFRRISDIDSTIQGLEKIEVSEEVAEGRVPLRRLETLRSRWARGGMSALWAAENLESAALENSSHEAAKQAVEYSAYFWEFRASEGPEMRVARANELAVLSTLLREFFGNPFRPVTIDPNWRTSTVVSIARGMYESRDFSPMPILTDALQDAGCNNEDILNHCRSAGPHVRGCWVVDLILGKS